MKRFVALVALCAATIAVPSLGHATPDSSRFWRWIDQATNPIWGAHGTTAADAIYPTVVKTGTGLRMWYEHRVDDTQSHIATATSTDAVSWTGGADLTIVGAVGVQQHPSAIKVANEYRLYYWVGDNELPDLRMATSTDDGATWVDRGELTFATPAPLVGKMPHVTVLPQDDGTGYVGYFTAGATSEILRATTDDAAGRTGWTNWSTVITALQCGGSCSSATVVRDPDGYRLWFAHGTDGISSISYAASDDGIAFTIDPNTGDTGPVWSKTDGAAWREDRTYAPWAIKGYGVDYFMWYTGRSMALQSRVGVSVGRPMGSVTLTQSGGSTAVVEGGAVDTYQVVLTSAPTANVSVRAVGSTQVSTAPAYVTFTASNWSVPQTITVAAVQDTSPEGPHASLVRHTSTSNDPAFDGLAIGTVAVSITDDDGNFRVTESGGVTAVAESGATDTYTIALVAAPTAPVSVAITPDAQVGVSPSALSFDASNWSVAQTVTVSAVNDTVPEGTHAGVITQSASSVDPAFNGPLAGVTAVIADNDNSDITPPPAPVITCPVATITQRTTTITGTSEPGTSVVVSVNGTARGARVADILGNWAIAITFTANGSYSLTAVATDAAGNVGPVSAPCAVVVDADFTPPPAPVITAPAQNAFTKAVVTIAGTAEDGATVRLYDNGIAFGAPVTATGGAWSADLTMAQGIHRVSAKATDASGNIGQTSAVRTFTVDTSAPSVSITRPGGYLGFQLIRIGADLRGSASDGLSGVEHIEITLTNLLDATQEVRIAVCAVCPGSPVTWRMPADVGMGIWDVSAVAYDRAGNISRDASDTLIIL